MNRKDGEHKASLNSEDTKKTNLGNQGGKRGTARARSANRNENRPSSRTRDRERYRQKGTRVIHNSYSGSVLNLNKVSADDSPTDQDPGARPKVVPSITKNKTRSRRDSVENASYKYQKGPEKMHQASRKETETSKHNKTHTNVFQDKSRHSENTHLQDNYSQLDTKDKSALQTSTMESKSPMRVLEKPNEYTGNDKRECEDDKISQLQNKDTRNRQKAKKAPSKKLLENRNNNKENRPSKKHQVKITYLYVLLSDKVTNSSDIKAFLEHRMGNPKTLDFALDDDLIEKTDQNNPYLISLKFSSFNKASVARHLLNVSNKNSSSKIRCFFDKEQANGQVVDKSLETKCKMEIAFKEIVETAINVSDKHLAKINDVLSKLSAVEKAMGKRRGLSLFEFEKFSNEKLAFEDKLEELERQQKEFRNYMGGVKAKLTQLIGCEKFEKKLAEVRKDFGVECRRLEDALPMYARRADILRIIKDNQVCVILGETGSGKSTQMAQYIFQAGVAAEGLIACTQPRKIAAINLATRVASELASRVGHEVGYKVGMQSKTSALTKVLFMTDHILLNECLHDELLTKYSCILIDEAHERSIYTDLLLGMLKKALICRRELKVVITSATIDPDVFVNYFGGIDLCPVLKVSGRTFPVDIVWEQDDCFENSFPDDYESKALNKVIEIHQSEPIEDGDILAFLTSAVEIERCCEKLKKQLGEGDLHCLQLHGKLKAEEQQLVFKATPPGKRKVVFATNSAETSITISGIKFVVDTGVVKEMRFDPKKNMNTLDVVSVSQSSANQRKGRAGRTARGVCYRLYTTSDFKRMQKMSSPEILRMQVSQALLKLMELGVDPMSFDYVQSPSKEAMKSALCELTRIGAVDESGLTNLGKWIAKLPVEPVLGVFIKKGIDMEISSEAFVVASCCNQSGIFYRVGTQEEKQMADMKKMKFCHKGGDLLTMLNVYREWEKIPEKSKGRWCQNNSINGKAMKSIREMTNEIITSLKKELDIKVKHCFKNAEDADSLVEKLVFECMSSNLGYYLGHESAGYLVVNRFQRVKIHPSSAVMSLGFQPSWVVFNRILKTSADFMTEVTPVSSSVIDKAAEDGTIFLDIRTLESQKVCCVLKVPVGKHVCWKFNYYSMRRQIEEDISAECDNSLIVVEANKQRGEIYLFCLSIYKDQASAMLLSVVESVRQQFLYESREEFIGTDDSGVRAVLRRGGAAGDILMPDEYRSLNIKQNECSRFDIDEECLRKCFEVHGIVEQIWRPSGKKENKSQFWGKVTFSYKDDAVAALEHINKDTDSDISLYPIRYQCQNTGSKQGFTMKVTWCRRPSKGHCFVYLDRPEDMALLLGSRPVINGATAVVSLSKQQSNLFVKGLMLDVTEDQVKDGLARKLDLTHSYQDRFRVVIPRMNSLFRKGEWLEKQEALINLVSRYATRESFRVKVLEYKEKTVMVIAFVTFFDSQICNDVTQQMISDNLTINGKKIQVSMEFKSTVHIKKKLYDMVVVDIENLIDLHKQRNSSTHLEIRHLKSGHISLDIKAVTPEKLAKTKVRVDRIVGGDVLECGEKKNLHTLFSGDGKRHAKDIEKTTGTMVFVDERQMRITIQGREKDRIRAVQMIEDFISKQIRSSEIEVCLKGEENPPGLLKALLVKYGIRFEELKKDTKISEIKLNLRHHEVTITGTEESVKLVLERIKNMKEIITKRNEMSVIEVEMPDCPVCLCPVEETDMYRLEYCGHAYCMICVTTQIQSAVSEKKMPVVCAAEDCNKPLVIRDFSFQIKMGKIKKKEIVDAAVECLVAENKLFRYCITPNCEVVYKVTDNGSKFVCPVCQANICTSCHVDFHGGLTCAMYKIAKQDDGSVEKWIKEDPQRRKMCPKCNFGIEKVSGCDHVTCRCGAHICWKCLKHFSRVSECYGHMNEEHASFV